jgi:uncharacterized protein (DUF433 family)
MRKQRSVRLLDHVDEKLEQLAQRTGRDVSGVINEILDEGLRMRQVPGIIFADTRRGREAKLAGTRLGVWEIIRGYREVNGDWKRFKKWYDWLNEGQLRAALAYAELYPDEIEERIRIDEEWTPERVWETYPFMRPPQAG